MTAGAIDVLFEVRNSFFLGNYQHCITEAQKVKVSSLKELHELATNLSIPTMPVLQPPTAAIATERDVLMYRSYIAQVQRSCVCSSCIAKAVVNARLSAHSVSLLWCWMKLKCPPQQNYKLSKYLQNIYRVLLKGVRVCVGWL